MNSNPRICLLSSGLDRFYETSTNLLKKQLRVELIPIDFYGLFWEPVDLSKLNSFTNGFQKCTVWTSPQRAFENFENVNKAPETNIKNFLSMSWGRYLLFQQMNNYDIWNQYDIFIYCRPDICLNCPLDYNYISSILDKNDLLIPSNGQWRGGVNDQFAVAAQKMSVYLNLFPQIIKYIGESILFHPETMLMHHLKANDVQWATYPIQNFIFRNEDQFALG